MKSLPVGLQLYSIRDLLEKTPQDFEAVMRQVKELGYEGVELAGLYGLSPEMIRDTLAKVGLTPVSAHVPLAEMMEDIEKVIHDYSVIGCRCIVIPYLPEEFRHLTPGYDKVISEMKRIGQALKDHGMTMLYHNHDFEFVTLDDGSFGLDDIYRQVPPELLQAEPDTCWIKVAGQDPAAYVRKYTGRTPIVHLKDFIKEGNPQNLYKLIGIDTEEEESESGYFQFRPVGFGQQVWEPILDASVDSGAGWIIVEQDEHYEIPAMEAARLSREYLKLLGW